ncbi:MAG: hypothetical protein ACSHXY_07600 [Alphaproteobacteria bacterium]
MRTSKTHKIHNFILKAGSILALFTAAQGPASAGNVDAQAIFSGIVLESCTVNISTPGTLGVSADGTTLTSEGIGGVSAIAAVITNSVNSTVEVVPPVAFTIAPEGAETNTTFSTNYALTGSTTATVGDGETATALNIGAHVMIVDAAATKSSGTYGAGAYTLVATVRCVAP